jgi:hypothetical protein
VFRGLQWHHLSAGLTYYHILYRYYYHYYCGGPPPHTSPRCRCWQLCGGIVPPSCRLQRRDGEPALGLALWPSCTSYVPFVPSNFFSRTFFLFNPLDFCFAIQLTFDSPSRHRRSLFRLFCVLTLSRELFRFELALAFILYTRTRARIFVINCYFYQFTYFNVVRINLVIFSSVLFYSLLSLGTKSRDSHRETTRVPKLLLSAWDRY